MNNAIFKIMAAAGSRFNTVNYNEKKVKRRKACLFILKTSEIFRIRMRYSKEEFKKYLQDYSAVISESKTLYFMQPVVAKKPVEIRRPLSFPHSSLK